MIRSDDHIRKSLRKIERRGRPLAVAIIGIACRFPGARDVEAFWDNVRAGRDCTSDAPSDRRGPEGFPEPVDESNNRDYPNRGGYLASPVEFDPGRNGPTPFAVEGGGPEQFLLLDAARAALDDAGLPDGIPEGRRVEVVIGRGSEFNRGTLSRLRQGRVVAQTLAILKAVHPDWSADDLEAVRADLKASLPPFEAVAVAGEMTNAATGRVAGRLDISGAIYVADAASASSLVALDLGTRAVAEGRADLALVGGVYLAVDDDFPQGVRPPGTLSRTGSARPFSSKADGTLPGEGVGVVVLKRLADADRDGDRVYAVVQAVGVVNDGRLARLSAPSARGHARAIRRAYRRSGIDPTTVGLIEGQGLGVPASDRAELRALNAMFPRPVRGRRALGAVSSIIGHALHASGIASLIKTALALHHRVIPPSQNADQPHSLIGGDSSPFELVKTVRPWVHGDEAHPRRAGVNAFGSSGINAHAVLEEHPGSAERTTSGWMNHWETEAILLGAADRPGCVNLAKALLAWLESGSNAAVPLKDLAFTLNTRQSAFPARVGMVVSSTKDLLERLRTVIARLTDPACRQIRDGRGTYFWDEPLADTGRLAFLFPGEGSQYPGMLADLCPHFPELRRVLDTSDRIATERGHAHLPSELLFGGTSGAGSGLWSIGTAVNVVLSSQWALYQVLKRLGLNPDAVVGHSSGEILALSAAGAFPTDRQTEDRLGELGSVFEGLEHAGLVPDSRLFAVAAARATVEAACRESGQPRPVVAIDNCPHQVVVAASPEQSDGFLNRLEGLGLLCEELPFQRAYHTAAFGKALEPLRAFYRDLPLKSPDVTIYSCSSGSKMPGDVASIRTLAVDQWARPVEFRSTVEAMHTDGVRLFVEVGARGSLAGFVEDTLRGKPHYAVAANLPRRAGVTQLNHLVASLYAHGVRIEPDALYARRRPLTVDLATDIPPRKPPRSLTLGFPEMKISPELAARLAARNQPMHSARLFGVAPADESPANRTGYRPEVSNGRSTARLHPNGRPPARNGDAPRTVATPAPAGLDVQDDVLLDHFRTMDLFLETQRQVMEAALQAHSANAEWTPGTSPDRRADVESPSQNGHQLNQNGPLAIPSIHELFSSVATAAERDGEFGGRADARKALLGQVSRRTGYPVEMLDLGQDMEGDLGIDSIKRVEILGELQNLGVVPVGVEIERLSRCRTLGQVLEVLDSGTRRESEPDGHSPWPGAIERLLPGREFVGLWRLDAEADPVASHHTLGGRRQSAVDPTRLGLPVIPFTVMSELLAQAASVVVPERTVVALRDVIARRWVPYPAQPTDLELHAIRVSERPDEVRVALKQRDGKDAAFEGVVVFGETRPAGPAPQSFSIEPRPCRFDAEELYRDQWLFHGPAMQALVRVGHSSPTGIEGALRVLPRRVLLPSTLWPRLWTDPIVLDAFTHLLGCWGLDKQAGEEGDVMFPLRVAEIALHGTDPAEGAEVECRIQVRDVTRHRVLVDAEILAPDHSVWVSLKGWEDWRFFWPDNYRDVLRDPRGVFVGESLTLDGETCSCSAVWLEPPGDMAKPVWGDVLEWIQLGPGERLENRARGEPETSLRSRTWGKIAAKEAVRRLWLGQGKAAVFPADLVVEHNEAGKPFLRSLVERERDDVPVVSLAHCEGVALALASPDPSALIGIDVEVVRPRGGGFEAIAFSDCERQWLDRFTHSPHDRDEWVARFWCGKEAASKATGLGMIEGPLGLEVVEVDRKRGRLLVRLGAVMASLASHLDGTPFDCGTARRGNYVFGWTTGGKDKS